MLLGKLVSQEGAVGDTGLGHCERQGNSYPKGSGVPGQPSAILPIPRDPPWNVHPAKKRVGLLQGADRWLLRNTKPQRDVTLDKIVPGR